MIEKIKNHISKIDITKLSISEILNLVRIIRELKMIKSLDIKVKQEEENNEILKSFREFEKISIQPYDIHEEGGD